MSELVGTVYDVIQGLRGVQPEEQRDRWRQQWTIEKRKYRDWVYDDVVEDQIRNERLRQMKIQTEILRQKYEANLDKARSLMARSIAFPESINEAERSGASFLSPIDFGIVVHQIPESYFAFLGGGGQPPSNTVEVVAPQGQAVGSPLSPSPAALPPVTEEYVNEADLTVSLPPEVAYYGDPSRIMAWASRMLASANSLTAPVYTAFRMKVGRWYGLVELSPEFVRSLWQESGGR